jgi:tRNA modification GTPase
LGYSALMHSLSGTIFAPATAAGPAGVAMIRLSGPAARMAVEALTAKPPPAPHRVAVRRFCDPATGEGIDRGLVLFFAAPASFTGEDVAEFHVHGGRAVMQAMTQALAAIPGCRLAEPGEFTRRAFEHGKLDLTEAEAVADIVAAQTAAQRRQALRQLEGELGAIYENWRVRLLRALAHVEADIDFPDEDLPQDIIAAIRPDLKALAVEMTAHLADARRGERLREGLHVAIVGAPNVGKSSLLNLLAQRDVAIVSEVAGTTRDVIEVSLDLAGWPVTLVDTAGLRDSPDAIEREGVRRARLHAQNADLRLVVVDATDEQSASALEGIVQPDDLIVLNKTDLEASPSWAPQSALPISIKTAAGIPALLSALQNRIGAMLKGDNAVATRQRHQLAVHDCLVSIQRAVEQKSAEIVAEDVRLAARALDRIHGKLHVECVLDAIFREFCIGK